MLNHPTATVTGLALLLASVIASAQLNKHEADNLLARVSYQSTYTVSWSGQKSSRICFALYHDGRYQMLKVSRGTHEVLEGTLSRDELDSISRMLNRLDPEKTNKVGMVKKGAESLVAQLVRKGGIEPYTWTDPDHQRTFPLETLRIVNWLQNFNPRAASRLSVNEMGEFSICPPPSAIPVPAVAPQIGTGAASSCGVDRDN